MLNLQARVAAISAHSVGWASPEQPAAGPFTWSGAVGGRGTGCRLIWHLVRVLNFSESRAPS